MVEKGPPLGGLVVKTPHFKCREREFDLRSHMPHKAAKKKKKSGRELQKPLGRYYLIFESNVRLCVSVFSNCVLQSWLLIEVPGNRFWQLV